MIKLFSTKSDRKKSKIKDQEKKASIAVYLKNPSLHKILMGLLLSLIIALLIPQQLTVPTYNYQLGDISRTTIRAPQDFSAEDFLSTEKLKQEKEAAVFSIYDYNSRADEDIEKRITTAFSVMRDSIKRSKKRELFFDKWKNEFGKILRIQVNDNDFAVLLNQGFKRDIENHLLELTLPFAQREVVFSKEQLLREWGRRVTLRDMYTKGEIVLDDYTRLIDVKDVQLLMRREARRVLQVFGEDVRTAILSIATKLIEPNFTFNKIDTATRKAAAVGSVTPVYVKVKKGEVIIREGERINEAALAKLQGLTLLNGYQSEAWMLAGYFILTFLSMVFTYNFTIHNVKNRFISFRDYIFLCSLLILFLLLLKLSIVTAKAFYAGSSFIPLHAYFYAIPFALIAMVISAVLNSQLAVISSIVVSLLAGILIESQIIFIIYPFISCIVAAEEASQCRERKTLIKAGLKVGAFNSLIIISISMLKGSVFELQTLINIGLGMLGGILSGILATGIIPVVEIIFNYTTNIKLLELADLNQPVLRNLIISAPGTYHHSIIVGSLVEAAAEAIHANPLLARVSAFYHDIGKMNKPLYFVENQKGGENKHDRLLPSMSSLILVSHVKDGVEIARKYRLGKSIQDIISQHHGTSINYFYQKVKEMNAETGQPLSDKDFRYPGPKPQTKEAGIVMLADAVEAASKTLTDPTPARIQGMVNRIITNIFTDGQLDECELTLKDIHLIAQNFIRILNGIFHTRVEYPDRVEKESNGTAKSQGTDQKPAKRDLDKSSQDQTDGKNNLGKLGVVPSRNKHSALG